MDQSSNPSMEDVWTTIELLGKTLADIEFQDQLAKFKESDRHRRNEKGIYGESRHTDKDLKESKQYTLNFETAYKELLKEDYVTHLTGEIWNSIRDLMKKEEWEDDPPGLYENPEYDDDGKEIVGRSKATKSWRYALNKNWHEMMRRKLEW